MSDILLPLHLRHARTSFRYLDSTGVSRGTFTGALVTAARGGDKLAATIELTKHGGRSADGKSDRALMRSFLASLRGRQNRAYLTDKSYTRRGTFPTGELLTNNTFANGTTGWSTTSSTITASDRVLRATRTAAGANDFSAIPSAAVSVTQYAPYAARFFFRIGRGAYSSGFSVYENNVLVDRISSITTQDGLITGKTVALGTTMRPALLDESSSVLAGDYLSVSYASLSRCALVDNGPNALLQSDTLGTTWTPEDLSSVASNSATAPDGTLTADTLVENSANNSHGIHQSASRTSTAADICAYGYFARGSGTRNVRLTAGNDGADFGSAIFDLGAGTVGSVSNAGAATNARAFIVDTGGNWYFCCVVARCPAAASLATFVQMHNGTGVTYTGDGTSSISGWRIGACVSSVPTRGALTTSTSSASGTSQTGSALYLKGLPASTNGLLEIDDQVEIITSRGSELKLVTARLNSDAAGLGYLQFEPALRNSPSDNAAVVVHQPMGRFLFSGDAVGWDNEPGGWSNASAEFEEAV